MPDFATLRVAEKALVTSQGEKPLPRDALIEPGRQLSGDLGTLYGDYSPVGQRDPSAGLGRTQTLRGNRPVYPLTLASSRDYVSSIIVIT